MYKPILTLLAILACTLCHAQTTVTGILQTADNHPVDYANIVLLAQVDSTFLTGTVSNEDGRFTLALPGQKENTYLIRVTNIGYKTICQPVQPGNIGILQMEEDAQMLSEVVVKGDLPVTRLKGDAMITSIEGTVLSKTGTAQDMLDYIPGVTSQKGNLQVLGRGAPVVYINGRLMRDASELEQLSSEDIQSVEVVNNPGARYDASVKAVIRIRTKKVVGEGFGLNSRTYAGYNKKWSFLEQVNLNYRTGGLDIFGLLFLSQNKGWDGMKMEQSTYTEKLWKQKMEAEGTTRSRKLIADLGMNYVFNPNHSVGFKYRYDRTPSNTADGIYNVDVTEDELLFEQTLSRNITKIQSTNHSLNMYYNGNLKDWTIDFNVDLLKTDRKDNQFVNEKITPVAGAESAQEVTTFNKVKNDLYASKLIVSHPLLGGEVAFGGEFSYTKRNTDYYNVEGILKNDDNKIEEDNVAAFLEYNRTWGKFQFQAGLRYEHVAFDYYQKGVFQKEQSRKYDDFFPSLSLGTSIGKVQMQLSYAQDISRPSFHFLRSNVYYANHYSYETGNPFLLPTITQNVSLTGIYKWWRLNVSYQHREDQIEITTVPYSDDDPNILLFKPINLKSYNMASAQLSATPTMGWWSPRFTAMVSKQWFETESPEGLLHLNKPQIYLRWQNSLNLPAGILLTLNGSWMSKYDSGICSIARSSWHVDAGLRKGFLNDRLTLQVSGYDLFQSERDRYITYEGKRYISDKVIIPSTRSITFTVRYRFNQGKDKYKGTGAGEDQKNRL